MILTLQQGQFGRSQSVAAGGPTDPYFSSVKLLCHFDGTDGQTTTIDSSSAAHTITASSNVVLSTAQAKFGTSSTDFSGSAGACSWVIADSADWNFGNGQFTMECFVRFATAPGSGNLAFIAQWQSNIGFYLGQGSGGQLIFLWSTTGSNTPLIGGAWGKTTGIWYHIAVDRDANNVLRVYQDGVVVASSTVTDTFYNSSSQLEIGCNTAAGRLPGYMDEVRITKGVARYGGAFTPPVAAFPDA